MYYVMGTSAVKRYVADMETGKAFRGRREEYTEATRQALLAAARNAFATDGYQAAGIEEISRAARVTRGAFYHHFEDKKALFEAVVTALQAEASDKIEKRARTKKDIWDRLAVGIDVYLDVCLEPAYARIVVQEAPIVLGNKRFREIEESYPMALLEATLRALKERGQLRFGDIGLLCRMIDAMICKVALLLPEASDPKALRRQGKELVDTLLEAYRVTAR
jgi:AcrR family transcriptional regulator